MRILKQTDPLALLHKQESPVKPKQPAHQNSMQMYFDETESQKSTVKIIIITLLLIVIIIGFCLIFGGLVTT